jgi:hypothetical protein
MSTRSETRTGWVRTNENPTKTIRNADDGNLQGLPFRCFNGVKIGIPLCEQGLRDGTDIVDI